LDWIAGSLKGWFMNCNLSIGLLISQDQLWCYHFLERSASMQFLTCFLLSRKSLERLNLCQFPCFSLPRSSHFCTFFQTLFNFENGPNFMSNNFWKKKIQSKKRKVKVSLRNLTSSPSYSSRLFLIHVLFNNLKFR